VGKCFEPLSPGETVLQNGDSTAKGFLDAEHVKVLPYFLIGLYLVMKGPIYLPVP
jgi:hypothetical protein